MKSMGSDPEKIKGENVLFRLRGSGNLMIIIRMYICVCNAVTERQVRACVDAGASSLDDLQFELGVATGCGRCAGTACEYLPGGRASTVCEVRDISVPVNKPAILTDQEQQPAANAFPIPVVVAA